MQKIRNIARIAHVDHGKTTLVDKMIYYCNIMKEHEKKQELILVRNDMERERGITILAKNLSVIYDENHHHLEQREAAFQVTSPHSVFRPSRPRRID
jgi:predicted membrane GTPase involved in stress response